MTVAEVQELIHGNFRRGEHEMEAGFHYPNDLNDNQRLLIQAFADEHSGKCWLGVVNIYRDWHPEHSEHPLWQWDGGLVYNFGARFVIPDYDAELERLILERDRAPYTGTAADSMRVDAIFARIAALGGHYLFWN